jgi:hypothetical protein
MIKNMKTKIMKEIEVEMIKEAMISKMVITTIREIHTSIQKVKTKNGRMININHIKIKITKNMIQNIKMMTNIMIGEKINQIRIINIFIKIIELSIMSIQNTIIGRN